MADKRISGFPAATQWHPDAFIPQDNPAGITEKVTPAQVEAKLEADGFIKAASPSLGQVAAYTAGGWAPIKLADANIDAAAAIGWGKISKTGAVASDIGAEPALGNPGVGNWWLSTFSGIRMWVATIPWGEVSKSGAVASDVGAELALGNPGPGTWYLRAIDNVRSWVASIPWGSISKTGAVASDVGALPVANPTATGTLTAPDVVVSNLAGTGTRPAAIDSTGKLVVSGGENSFAVKSASFTLSASTERVIRTQGAITVTLPAASSLQGYSYTFLQEQVGGGALTFSPPEPWFSSVSASAWVEHAGSWGFSIAWRRADLTSDGLNWLATLQ